MRRTIALLMTAIIAAPALAQLVPSVDVPLGRVTDTLGSTIDRVEDFGLQETLPSVRELARDRLARLAGFARQNAQFVELDENGDPARRGVVLLMAPDAPSLAQARKLGFVPGATLSLGTLGLETVELTVPEGMTLKAALKALGKALPDKSITADSIHFPSGKEAGVASPNGGAALSPINATVGIIDGGVGSSVAVRGQRSFAKGGPVASDHGTAVASLLAAAGVRNISAADVYGRDPAGGSALAIAGALDWMVSQEVPVLSLSLVGPRNALVEAAVRGALARGTVLVAAVGNDGPAAPPAYPASYPGVLAVTGVDGRQRALIEAGRSLHLDYAAPGADMTAANASGERRKVRGTSFAAPLVAARAAAAIDGGARGTSVRAALDKEARDLGKKGPDPVYGRGLVCGSCAAR